MSKFTQKKFLFTASLTVVLCSIGFALLQFNLLGYGFTFFILVPLCIGYFLGEKPTLKMSSLFAFLVGLVAFFYLLITAQLEGLFCVVLLLPIILILMPIGMFIGWEIRKQINNINRKDNLRLTLYPLIVLLFSGTIEHFFIEKYDGGRVESKIFLPYPKEVVFDYIKSVDTLNTEKPFLLKLGLSVPEKCILQKEEVGGKRICYFREGTIEEKVTKIKRGEILKMDVTNFGLPGRKWLKFQEAIYLFEAKDNGTILTRVTTYTSELKPRFYWRYWEEKSIEAEHEYVLNDLKQRLGLKK